LIAIALFVINKSHNKAQEKTEKQDVESIINQRIIKNFGFPSIFSLRLQMVGLSRER